MIITSSMHCGRMGLGFDEFDAFDPITIEEEWRREKWECEKWRREHQTGQGKCMLKKNKDGVPIMIEFESAQPDESNEVCSMYSKKSTVSCDRGMNPKVANRLRNTHHHLRSAHQRLNVHTHPPQHMHPPQDVQYLQNGHHSGPRRMPQQHTSRMNATNSRSVKQPLPGSISCSRSNMPNSTMRDNTQYMSPSIENSNHRLNATNRNKPCMNTNQPNSSMSSDHYTNMSAYSDRIPPKNIVVGATDEKRRSNNEKGKPNDQKTSNSVLSRVRNIRKKKNTRKKTNTNSESKKQGGEEILGQNQNAPNSAVGYMDSLFGASGPTVQLTRGEVSRQNRMRQAGRKTRSERTRELH